MRSFTLSTTTTSFEELNALAHDGWQLNINTENHTVEAHKDP